ncbi:MAG: polyphosphate polymerase domain-containing protein [Eubacteriales bacterium]
MTTQMVFKRYELKYLLTREQYEGLKQLMEAHMVLDEYGKHTIRNIYFDTPDYRLIRRSIEKPCYKEKLRVRSYGDFKDTSKAYVEMKKKYKGVVYKRRLPLEGIGVETFLEEGKIEQDNNQIAKELSYFMHYYQTLKPAVALHYEREAYYGIEDHDFRMTFDQNIRINATHITLGDEREAVEVLPEGSILLEVKTAMGIPQWLLHFFSEHHIFKKSFSKYGTAYLNILLPQQKGGSNHVA